MEAKLRFYILGLYQICQQTQTHTVNSKAIVKWLQCKWHMYLWQN